MPRRDVHVDRTASAWLVRRFIDPGAEFAEGMIVRVIAFGVAPGSVAAIWAIVNPDKLRHLGPVDDLAALLRRTFKDPQAGPQAGNRRRRLASWPGY